MAKFFWPLAYLIITSPTTDGRTLGIYSLGCSASTYLLRNLAHIGNILDYNMTRAYYELLNPKSGLVPSLGHYSVNNALEYLMVDAAKHNSTLILKLDPDHFYEGLETIFFNHGGHAVISWRQNDVAWLTCQVRDCWSKLGHPVFLNGSSAEVCFNRRSKGFIRDTEIQAHFDIVDGAKALDLIRVLDQHHYRPYHYQEHIGENFGRNINIYWTEDLLRYEDYPSSYSKVQESFITWRKMLTSLGLSIDKDRIRKHLTLNSGSRVHYRSLNHKINNYRELKVFLNSTIYSGLLP